VNIQIKNGFQIFAFLGLASSSTLLVGSHLFAFAVTISGSVLANLYSPTSPFGFERFEILSVQLKLRAVFGTPLYVGSYLSFGKSELKNGIT